MQTTLMTRSLALYALLAALCALPIDSAYADKAAEALSGKLKNLAPGDTMEIDDGTYVTTGHLNVNGVHGTAERPVTIRAKQRGRAIIRGHAGFSLQDCEHVVIEGFTFENDANQQAVLLDNCRHVRVTRCTFRLSEKEKPRWGQYWVNILGARSGRNRIDHCLFEQQKNRGSMVFVRGDDATLTPTQYDRVDHNHFRDVIYAEDANGHETIRTGSNDLGAAGKSTFTTIEDNLLERCSGEQEIISLKSSGNTVRRNTFIDCRGCICLRLGHRSEVTENIMLNPGGIAGAGGVKIYGVEQRVTKNYFQDLTGTGHESPLVIAPGYMNTETTDQLGKAYKDATTTPATRGTIADNVWVDCTALMFGHNKPLQDLPYLPSGCTFAGNVVIRTKPLKTLIVRPGLTSDFSMRDNIARTIDDAPKVPWAAWFRWEKAASPADTPRPEPLSPKQVGPNAVD